MQHLREGSTLASSLLETLFRAVELLVDGLRRFRDVLALAATFPQKIAPRRGGLNLIDYDRMPLPGNPRLTYRIHYSCGLILYSSKIVRLIVSTSSSCLTPF